MAGKNKVLIVDDDNALRELLCMSLQKHSYEIYSAKDGEEALTLCEKHKPDLIILDVTLPDMLGPNIIEKIRSSEEEYGYPKIIVMTGLHYSINDARDRWMNTYDIVEFFNKPIDYNELISITQSALRTTSDHL